MLLRKYWSVSLALSFLSLSLVYLIIVGNGAYIQVHDNLDSNIAWFKMLADNHLFWSTDTKVPFLGGISRDYMYSELKAYNWLYMIFSPFTAYIIGWYLHILIAIAGFVALGQEIFGNRDNFNWFVSCGLLYGIIPTFPTCAFSFASIPLFFCVLFKLYREFKYKHLLFMLFYPLISDFSLFGFFICGVVFILSLICSYQQRKIVWRLLLACIALSIGYILTEWHLFYVMLFANEETIRKTFIVEYVGWLGALKRVLEVFLLGHYHSGSSHLLVVLPVVVYGWYCLNKEYLKTRNYVGMRNVLLNWILVAQLICCIAYGIDHMEWFRSAVGILIPPLKGFNWGRALWFAPFLWYFAFMLVICETKWKTRYKQIVVIMTMLSICFYPSVYNDVFLNVKNQVKMAVGKQVNELTYREFYAENLFKKAKQQICYGGEWSVAYGFHPAVLEYNGIATLDGYLSFYSKSYKDEFRKLIEPELAIDEKNRKYFDTWGGRAYVFSPDLSYNPNRERFEQEVPLYMDMEQFRKMGGVYVFSRAKLSNGSDLNLTEVGVFSDKESPYVIYVYRVN